MAYPYVQGTTSGAGHVACARIALRVCSRVCVVRGTGMGTCAPVAFINRRARAKRRGESRAARRSQLTRELSLSHVRLTVVLPSDRTVTSLLVSSRRSRPLGYGGTGQLISFLYHILRRLRTGSPNDETCSLYLSKQYGTFYAASAASYPINTIRLPLHSVETLWSPFNNPFRPCARDRLQLGRRARSQARRARWPRT